MATPTSDVDTLTIGELARRTGVAVGTLRMWETRHGFPSATRLPSGHRRYAAATVPQVVEVARRRDGGTRLDIAIAAVASGSAPAAPSVYATLRQQHPHLHPHRLRKSTLLAVTWAMEDECCARAQRPWLFGAFQEERFYRQAERRWRELARTARGAWALAAFTDPRRRRRPSRWTCPPTHPCAGSGRWSASPPTFPSPSPPGSSPGRRARPTSSASSSRCGRWSPARSPTPPAAAPSVVGALGHDADAVLRDAEQLPATASGDLRHATALFHRVLSYVDRLG